MKKNVRSASENHDVPGEVTALQEIGLVHLTRTNDYEAAMDAFIQALALGDSLQLNHQQVFTCLGIATIFKAVGNFPKSKDFLSQALTINKKLNDPFLQGFILNELGNIETSMSNIPEAFAYYEQVLELQDEIKQPAVEAEALFNIGYLHLLQRDYRKALDFQKRSLVIWRADGDKNREAFTLSSIGEIYGEMKNRDKELANHEAALKIRQNIKDKAGIAASANLLGIFYYKHDNFKKAIGFLETALKAGQESQNQDQLGRTYDYLSLSLQATKKYKEALEYKDLLLKFNDFTQHEKNERRLLETQNSYALGLKQSAITKLQISNTERERQLYDAERFRNILFALILLITIIIVLILVLYINKRKSNALLTQAHNKLNVQNLELKELNATKDKFFSIIGHDLKGPLNSLTSFSNLLSNHLESLTADEIKMLSSDLDKQLKNLFALLNNLLEWSRSQTGAIEFVPEPFDITQMLEDNKQLLNGQALTKKITLMTTEKTGIIVKAHRDSINTVIRNLTSNAIKFTPANGTILIDAQAESGMIKISISDTGVGMSPDTIKKLFRIDTKHSTKGTADEKGTGLGLILCHEFVEKNGGKIWVESEPGNGSVFYFTVPQ